MARRKRIPGTAETVEKAEGKRTRSASATGGQSGDLQGLDETPQSDSESVRELAEEGQAFEAAVLSGIENAPPADAGEVTTRQVPEDDVPEEYLDEDKDIPKE